MKNPEKAARKEVRQANGLDYETDPKRVSDEQRKKYLTHGKFPPSSRAPLRAESENPRKEGAKWDKVTKSQSVDKAKRLDEKMKRKLK